MTPGLIIAAPSTGSGKTVFTLGLLRLLARQGVAVASAKAGPDYIDPAFHAAATGRACVNLDGWAMRPDTLAGLAAGLDAELVVCEGVMGLFDGANVPEGEAGGSTADLAAATGWPVVLVMDVRGQSGSAAAVLQGFAGHRPDVAVVGVVFNRVGGMAHCEMLGLAAARHCPDVPVLGYVPRDAALTLPSRHLGLVQARETTALDAFLDAAADLIESHVDLGALCALARPIALAPRRPGPPVPPLGARIAVAYDDAFAFVYPATLAGWQEAGAALSFFSPLADEAPDPDCDAVYLPGGYPELHAGRLAGNAGFLDGLRRAAAVGALVFGECGGYMVLGEGLIDADGRAHPMAGLLPVSTSFQTRRLHLGYRRVALAGASALGAAGQTYRGHEFHYATVTAEGAADPLFHAADAAGRTLGPMGCGRGPVMGSFVHLIDREHA